MFVKERISNRFMLGLAAVTLAFTGAVVLRAGIIHVDYRATGADDGTSWTDAYIFLQSALVGASDGDEIRVAGGDPNNPYRPDHDPNNPTGTGDREATFQLIDGVGLYGGYAGLGDPNNPGVRDLVLYETILSGDIGAIGDPADNSFHVVTASGTNNTARLDGFTITAGKASGDATAKKRGAGMYNIDGDPTLVDCTFTGNAANSEGGGVYSNSNPSMTNCTFTNNTSAVNGGGMATVEGSPTLTNCTFTDNWVSGYMHSGGGLYNTGYPTLINCSFSRNWGDHGGGVSSTYGNPTFINCTFSGNWAFRFGGGMCNWSYYTPVPNLTDCTFIGNAAKDGSGAAIFNRHSHPVLTNCTFSGNRAIDGSGAGIFNYESDITLTHCIFSGNRADSYGGGIYSQTSSSHDLTNCTFVGNWANRGGGCGCGEVGSILTNCTFGDNMANSNGGALWTSTSDYIWNCILWGNTPEEVYVNIGNPEFKYCDVAGGSGQAWFLSGCIDADPLFLGGTTGTWTQAGAYDGQTYQVTLTDDNATWVADELIGKYVNPDTTQVLQFSIIGNTATTMTVWGDWSTIDTDSSWVTSGMNYQIHDYHLTAGSPCIDAGYTQSCQLDDTDIDDEFRVMDGWIEMGVDEFTGVSGYLYGDLDCDCYITGLDIDPFALALSSAPSFDSYYAEHPGCNAMLADCNADGSVNSLDIDMFVTLLSGG